LLRAMGAGDVKLMAAVGSIAGPQNWIVILICTALAGGVIAIAVAIRNKRLQRTLINVAVLAGELSRLHPPAAHNETLDVKNTRSMRLPHGVAIAAGSLAFLLLNPTLHPLG
jgi:prepilin peptidase CpaA